MSTTVNSIPGAMVAVYQEGNKLLLRRTECWGHNEIIALLGCAPKRVQLSRGAIPRTIFCFSQCMRIPYCVQLLDACYESNINAHRQGT